MRNKITALFLILILAVGLIGCKNQIKPMESKPSEETITLGIEKDGKYSKPEEVAAYIHIYNQLPKNYLTKKEAEALGWESRKGNLWDVTDKKSIGGDVFGNREGLLPKAEGRQWYECDVNYFGGFRGEERLVYSNDGLIFYTKDHYKTFTEVSLGGEKTR